MATIPGSVRRIKADLFDLVNPHAIQRICEQLNYRWRVRALDPVTTIHLFMLQILHGNTACRHVARLSHLSFSASAYCQARGRLPLELIRRLALTVRQRLQAVSGPVSRWRGHRLVMVDGSSFSMPDTPALQAHFGQSGCQRRGCGFPTAHLLIIVEAGTGYILDLLASPLRTHDMSRVSKLHGGLQANDVLLADRGFCSFAHFALLAEAGVHAVFRIHHQRFVKFYNASKPTARGVRSAGSRCTRWRCSHGHEDQEVSWLKPVRAPRWMSPEQFEALPDELVVRTLRYRVNRRGFRVRCVTLATTLLDPHAYPKQELEDLYRTRWQVETHLRDLKTTMGMDVLRCTTVESVLKEVWMFVLIYNLVRKVILEASRAQAVPPDRVSFIDALRWLTHASPDDQVPDLVINPDRFGRIQPRVVKRRPKQYARMGKPRSELLQLLLREKVAA